MGADVDQPGQRVGAIARALRSAQHFDLLDVEGAGGHADPAEVDVVDQQTDRRIRRPLVLLQLTHPAQQVMARP